MPLELQLLLPPKIEKYCMALYSDGHYKHAAHEAMIRVEQALKEKGKVNDKRFGQTLITSLFRFGDNGKYIRLRVPLGDELQEYAENYFKGVFSYYRNYTAHDGSRVDQSTCLRIMIIASELLDLIDASSLSFEDLGGVDGLLEAGAFKSKEQLIQLLKLLHQYHVPDGAVDGLREDLLEIGMDDFQIDAVIELDLVRYHEDDYVPALDELASGIYPPKTIGWFELTQLGRETMDNIQANI